MNQKTQTDTKDAKALHDEGLALLATGAWDKALERFDAAIAKEPGFLPAYYSAADIYDGMGFKPHALNYLLRGIETHPGQREIKEKFIATMRGAKFRVPVPAYRKVIEDCLVAGGFDFSGMESAWYSILLTDRAFAGLFAALTRKSWEDSKTAFAGLIDKSPVTSPFFLEGLKVIKLGDVSLELFLMRLRRLLLEEINGEGALFDKKTLTRIAVSLGHACYYSEYVFDISEDEKSLADGLRDRCEKKPDEASLAVLSCYQPLCSLASAAKVQTKYKTGVLSELVKLQISDVSEREEIRKTIPAITPIENSISRSVRAQYEESPYPKWLSIAAVRSFKEKYEGHLAQGQPRILVAGCGTGKEPCELALDYPNADVLAVDLSLSSLSYGVQRTRRLGFKNVRFAQGDILELGVLDEKFDLVACSGVLHHMEDPFKGWQVITGLLKEGGTMRICLYSEIARKSIVEARKVIAAKGYESSADGIRRFRRDAPKVLSKKAYKKVTGSLDYYSLSECRDLLFHVQEHRFTFSQIKEHLDRLGLAFEGLVADNNALDKYRRKFRKDPEAKNLDNWAKFEKKNPDTFIAMYHLWCRKI